MRCIIALLYANNAILQWSNKPQMMNNTQIGNNSPIKTPDRRVRRTDYAIKMAFLDLMQSKALNQINISELAQLADIDRKTFYNHYQDIYQVLGSIEDDYADMVISFLDQAQFEQTLSNPYPFFHQLTQEIQNNGAIYQLLMKNNEHARLSKKIKTKLKQHLQTCDSHLIKFSQIQLDFLLDFILAGVMSAYEQWFSQNQNLNSEQLSALICQIVAGAFKEFQLLNK